MFGFDDKHTGASAYLDALAKASRAAPGVSQMGLAARAWASLGFAVVPCHIASGKNCSCRAGRGCGHAGKHPWTRRGVRAATTDPITIRRWWRAHPNANIGVATGMINRLLGIDVDGDAGVISWASVTAHHGHPQTATVRSGSGGLHLLFGLPESFVGWVGCPVGSALGVGVHVRGEGGHLVAPPSVHHSGRRYRWANDRQINDAPNWLLDLLRTEPPSAQGATPAGRPLASETEDGASAAWRHRQLDLVRTASPGTRNDTLFRRALPMFGLVKAGLLDEATTRRLIVAAADGAGLTSPETRATLDSAWTLARPSTPRRGASS